VIVDPDSIAQSARGGDDPFSVIAEIGDVDVRNIENAFGTACALRVADRSLSAV